MSSEFMPPAAAPAEAERGLDDRRPQAATEQHLGGVWPLGFEAVNRGGAGQ